MNIGKELAPPIVIAAPEAETAALTAETSVEPVAGSTAPESAGTGSGR